MFKFDRSIKQLEVLRSIEIEVPSNLQALEQVLSDLTTLCDKGISRLVRKTLSFSKKIEHLTGVND